MLQKIIPKQVKPQGFPIPKMTQNPHRAFRRRQKAMTLMISAAAALLGGCGARKDDFIPTRRATYAERYIPVDKIWVPFYWTGVGAAGATFGPVAISIGSWTILLAGEVPRGLGSMAAGSLMIPGGIILGPIASSIWPVVEGYELSTGRTFRIFVPPQIEDKWEWKAQEEQEREEAIKSPPSETPVMEEKAEIQE